MKYRRLPLIVLAFMVVLSVGGLAAVPANAQGGPTPPDTTVCDGVTCENLPGSVCSDAGFKITLMSVDPANFSNNGSATYNYQLCSPAAGTCNGTVRNGEPCLDDSFCQKKGPNEDPTATCSRECAVNEFRGLSHLDVNFPELGASCLSADTSVTGTCTAVDNTPTDGHTASVGNFVLGDGSCYTATSPVAKCDSTELNPGDCVNMALTIAGELTDLGTGAAVVVDKESTSCTASCLAGPSCDTCGGGRDGEQCLTRTIGFWGTHPWITNDYAPVMVCGKPLDCSGADDGKSNPSCLAGSCDSVMEGLGSIPSELSTNQPYVAMVKQLTAAKLNLNATAALFDAECSSWTYLDKGIQDWVTYCESLCSANKPTISNSGCIEALTDFNSDQDVGFDVTPAPFDQPPLDDHGNISGADPSQFTAAQGQTNPPGKLVIGKKVGSNDCRY